jgi:hypothetical protein
MKQISDPPLPPTCGGSRRPYLLHQCCRPGSARRQSLRTDLYLCFSHHRRLGEWKWLQASAFGHPTHERLTVVRWPLPLLRTRCFRACSGGVGSDRLVPLRGCLGAPVAPRLPEAWRGRKGRWAHCEPQVPRGLHQQTEPCPTLACFRLSCQAYAFCAMGSIVPVTCRSPASVLHSLLTCVSRYDAVTCPTSRSNESLSFRPRRPY